jgi:hypothetical protein
MRKIIIIYNYYNISCICSCNQSGIDFDIVFYSNYVAIVVEGLFGNLVKIPVAPMVIIEYKICRSLWGDYNELREFIELQNQEKNK